MAKEGFGNLNLTSEFTKHFAKHTNMFIDLYYIKHEALFDRSLNGRITIANSIKFSDVREVLYKENAIFKNSLKSSNKENVYFSYSRNNTSFNIAFVDDLQGESVGIFKRKNHFCLVQTSQLKYQGYFLLDRYTNADELYKIQKVLQEVYKGDKGALGAFQLKRMTGFFNTKYEPAFLVKVVYVGAARVNVDKILQYYELHFKPDKVKYPEKFFDKKSDGNLKCWQDFNIKDDKSQVDMSYAVYLVRMGFDEDDIYERLLEESEGIKERKGKYIDDYIERTIAKAIEYVSNLKKPKK